MPTALGTVASHYTKSFPFPGSGLAGWWDASDTGIGHGGGCWTWYDKSGRGRHFIATGAGAPVVHHGGLNGLPVLGWGTAADNRTMWVGETTTYRHFFAVVNYSGGMTFIDYPGFLTGINAPEIPEIILIGAVGQDDWYSGGQASTSTYFKGGIQYGLPFPAPMYNHWDQCNISNTNGWGVRLQLGAERNNGRFWNGYVAEIIAYDRVLSSTERQQVETYLKNKWGLSYLPIKTQGLVGWWDASYTGLIGLDGGLVTSWGDRSGNGNHAWAAPGQNPWWGQSLNGKATVYFPGAGHMYANLPAMARPFTMFATAKLDTFGVQRCVCLLRDDSRIFTDGSNYILSYAGVILGPIGNWGWGNTIHQVTAVFNGGSSRIQSDHSGVMSGNTGTNAVGSMLDIGTVHGVTEYWYGHIAEIALYNREVPQAECEQMAQYMIDKWGVQV